MISIVIEIIKSVLGILGKKVDSDAEVEKVNVTAKSAVLMAGSFWFQLFFIVPLSMWFSSVVLYSILFCKACAYPQVWSIAALPAPLNEWAGWIVSFLFLAHVGRMKR